MYVTAKSTGRCDGSLIPAHTASKDEETDPLCTMQYDAVDLRTIWRRSNDYDHRPPLDIYGTHAAAVMSHASCLVVPPSFRREMKSTAHASTRHRLKISSSITAGVARASSSVERDVLHTSSSDSTIHISLVTQQGPLYIGYTQTRYFLAAYLCQLYFFRHDVRQALSNVCCSDIIFSE